MSETPIEAAPLRGFELILTARCNLKCAYCFENDKKDLTMSWEVVRATMDRALASPVRAPTVLFFGGEPTLEFATIRRAVAYALERLPRDKRLRWAINTNGTLLGTDEIAFLAEHRFTTQLSMDGVPEAQILRGRGTFELLDSLFDTLRGSHPAFFKKHVSVGMTISPRTIPYLARSVDYLLEKGVREIGFSPKMTFDPYWNDGMVAELERQFAAVFRSSVQHYRRYGNVPLVLFRKPGRGARMRARPERVAMCGVGRADVLAVDVDGTSHGCAMFARSYQKFPSSLGAKLHGLEMGDVREAGLEGRRAHLPQAIEATGIFHDKQEKYSSLRRCRDCRFLTECGICPTSIVYIPGNIDPRRVPDFLCAFSYASLAARARFPRERPRSAVSRRRDAAFARAHTLIARVLASASRPP